MKIKRLAQMSELERSIMLMIWSDIKDRPVYKEWQKYSRDFTFEKKNYSYQCLFKIEDGNLRLMHAKIEHAQEVIDILH